MFEERNTNRLNFDAGPTGPDFGGQSGGNGFTYRYDYEPQGGGSGGNPQRSPRRSSPAISILTVLLCVVLSFGAGVGGATMAYNSLAKNTGETLVPAPNSGSMLNDDPSAILNRTESAFSPYGSAGEDAYSISTVVNLVKDAVVVINASSVQGTSAGSGVIISDKGYILTCNHVVDGATKIAVTVNGCANAYLAKTVGTDERTDLAVLKIEPQESEPLTAATHGISDNLVVGERVVAIGNPLGTLGGTVTDGIISAKARRVQTDSGVVMTLLQTNAAINSGNSGGGLFNLKGELIGIVNAKYAKSGVEGLAFAIPVDTAYVVEKDLIQHGYVQGIPDIGISLMEVSQSDLENQWIRAALRRKGITKVGLYVYSSKHCDLKYTDYILTVNGTAVATQAEFEAAVADLKVGDTLTVTYLRSGSDEEQSVSFEIPQYVPDGVSEKNS